MEILCEHCNGNGVVELTGVHAETLDMLEKNPDMIATDLAKKMGCTPQTMWNRLRWLELHGLAEKRKYGHLTYFSAKNH